VKFRDLVPEFVETVRRKMYPNRSIAINPDHSIAHVGFLGAKPPAVKGMAPIAGYAAQCPTVVEFTTQVWKEGMDMATGKSAAEEIQRRCFAEMAKDSNLTYGDAFQRVTASDRNLSERYLFEARNPGHTAHAAAPGKSAAEEIQRRCFAEMAKESGLTYSDAFTRVTTADHKLCERYMAEARGRIFEGAEREIAANPNLSYTQAVKQSILETCKNLDDSMRRAIEELLR
jgi:hypothetical protein